MAILSELTIPPSLTHSPTNDVIAAVYQFLVQNPNMQENFKTLLLEIDKNPPPPPTGVAPPAAQVRILSFSANPDFSPGSGAPVTLSWTTENATSVIITGTRAPSGPLPLSGSAVVNPVSNSDYTLTAYGSVCSVSVVLHLFVR
jgi:hypothetical protein